MDRRDAVAVSELVWGNQVRIPAGNRVRRLRQVEVAAPSDQENRWYDTWSP